MYCKRCGARLQQGMIICPNCGARQRRQSRTIRCAHCRGRALADMMVCPHCGRNLVPAGPRWALWLPLAALLAFLVYRGLDRLPIVQIRQEAEAVQAQLAGLIQLPPTPGPKITLTQGTALARAVQVTPVPSFTPTPTITPTRPLSATPAPTATPTATTVALEYEVQPGDSLALIGEKLGVPWQTIAALNNLGAFSMIRPGDKLRLPTPTPASTHDTATPTGVTTMAVVGTGAATPSPTTLPVPTATVAKQPPTATAQPTPAVTPTPTATPTRALPAPILINPGNQAAYSGDAAQIVLEWQMHDGLPRGAVYRLMIAWTEKGTPITWSWDTTATSLRVAGWLWQRSDQPTRRYTWWVQVVQRRPTGDSCEPAQRETRVLLELIMMLEELASLLQQLADENRSVRTINLAGLSGLSRSQAATVYAALAALSVRRRREVVSMMAEQAEANVHLNFLAIMRECLNDSDAGVRKTAIDGLWEDERPNLIAPLIRLLAEDPAAEVRAAAAISLARFALLGALGELDEIYAERVEAAMRAAWFRAGEVVEVRRRALEGLAYTAGADVNELIEMAYFDENELMRQSALFAMGRTADRRWAKYVLRELDSQDPGMRYEAAAAAGELALNAAVKPLIRLLEDADSTVRETAALALGKIGGPAARRALEACLESSDHALAEAADEALEELIFNSEPLDAPLLDYRPPSRAALADEEEDEFEDEFDDDSFNEDEFAEDEFADYETEDSDRWSDEDEFSFEDDRWSDEDEEEE